MEKQIIIWNLVNSFLAGGLVITGALSDGNISKQSLIVAIVIGIGVMISQFKDFWSVEKKSLQKVWLFKFI